MPPIYKYSKILKQYINPDELPNMNVYNHPNYPDSPQTEKDSFELGKLQEVPEYPYHYLMVEKMSNLTALLLVWAKMDRSTVYQYFGTANKTTKGNSSF